MRLPRRAESAPRLEKECRWLPALAPLLPLAVPVPVARGEPDDGYPLPWAVYPWLPGERATPARIADPRELADSLAGFVAALHGIDPAGGPAPGEHNFFRGVPLARRDAAVRAAIASLRDELDADEVTAGWEESLRAPAWRGDPVWIHGDLDAQNLLVVDGRLAGVVDWGGLGVGDPACDAMAAWKVLDAGTRPRFREALALDDATWARSRGWAISQAVVALAYYTTATHPVLVREATRWLGEALRG